MSLVGPRRVTAPGIAFNDLPPIDVVVVSHNHYDHLDARTLSRLQKAHQPTFVTPAGNAKFVEKAAAGARVQRGGWGDGYSHRGIVDIVATPAHHWSRRGVGDTRRALWSSFMIRTKKKCVWFGGDTGYGDGSIFSKLREEYGEPDLALIPIGAYEPRWFMKDFHVNPQEAVRIFQDLGARRAIGMHWGTFQLTDEGREQPKIDLTQALGEAGISRDLFLAGEPGFRISV